MFRLKPVTRFSKDDEMHGLFSCHEEKLKVEEILQPVANVVLDILRGPLWLSLYLAKP